MKPHSRCGCVIQTNTLQTNGIQWQARAGQRINGLPPRLFFPEMSMVETELFFTILRKHSKSVQTHPSPDSQSKLPTDICRCGILAQGVLFKVGSDEYEG